MHSRHTASARLSQYISLVIARVLRSATLLISFASAARAQGVASVPAVPSIRADSLRPPITPGRAFFLSLVFPGAAQNILGRHKVAVGVLGVEMASIAMIRESGFDVREARQQQGDSLVVSYVDQNGAKLATPIIAPRRFGNDEINSRRSHVEDWVALLLANHLFAAADAFVAANLWDVNARVTAARDGNRLMLGARVKW
jgi:hypothetical protein